MKHYAFSLALAVLLLVSGIAGFGGCTHPNPLTAIVITVPAPVIAKGKMHQLYVTAIFSNRLAVPAWSQVTWTSSDPAVATVSTTGLVLGIATGTTEITATDIFHPSITHTVTAFVTDLQSLVISPAIATMSSGTTQFSATGIYSADTPTGWSAVWPPDLTTLVSWASSSTDVAIIGNIAGIHGVATAVAAGTTAITATDLATGITGTAVLAVVP